MSIAIGNSYDSYYYTQVSNNSRSNTNKTIVSDTSSKNKTISKEDYFESLCNKYTNINLNISNSYLSKENEISYNVSPALISKATSNSEVAEKLNDILDQAQLTAQYINTHKSLDGNSEVKSVSFLIDENGGCSCKVELKSTNSNDAEQKSETEKLRENRRKELKVKVQALKEAQEKNSEVTKEQKATDSYENLDKVYDISLLNVNA